MKTVKSLRFHLTFKLTNELATVSCILTEDRRLLDQRQQYFITHTRNSSHSMSTAVSIPWNQVPSGTAGLPGWMPAHSVLCYRRGMVGLGKLLLYSLGFVPEWDSTSSPKVVIANTTLKRDLGKESPGPCVLGIASKIGSSTRDPWRTVSNRLLERLSESTHARC